MELHVIIFFVACIALVATFSCLALYLYMYIKCTNRFIGMVGILNLLIAPAIAVIAVMTPYEQQSASFIYPAIPGIIFVVGLFMIGQLIYLLSSRSPLRRQAQQQIPEGGQPTQQIAERRDTERIDQELRYWLQRDDSIRLVQILDMSYQLETADMYVPIKVLAQNGQISEDDDDENSEEILFPETRFKRNQERQRERLKDAEDPIEIVTREHWKHCVILGEPGIGKTTFLRYLALQVAQSKVPAFQEVIPIYIALNDLLAKFTQVLLPKEEALLPEEEGILLKFIVSYYHSNYRIDITSFLKERCEAGKILLLLDGLDETFGGETRKEARENYEIVHQAIEAVAKKYKDIRILVTARKTSYELQWKLTDADGAPFNRLVMPGFSEENVQSFVKFLLNSYQKQYSRPRPEIEPAKLLQALQRERHLRDLSKRPLLLAMITLVYSRGYDVSSYCAEIYDACVNQLLKRWDSMRGLDPAETDLYRTSRYSDFKPDEKYDLLKKLALQLQNQKVYKIKKDAILDYTRAFLNAREWNYNEEDMINEIIVGSGLLIKASGDTYKFSHEIFQEYFAAQALVAQGSNPQLINKLTPWWEGVILLYAAYSNVADIVAFLLDPKYKDFFHTNLLLAGRYIATTLKLSSFNTDSVQEAVKQLMDILTAEDTKIYRKLQEDVAMILAETAQKDSETPLSISKQLIEIVKDHQRQPELRKIIIDALGKWGNNQIVEYYTQALSQPELDEDLRSHIARALAQRRDGTLAAQLVPLLAEPTTSAKLRQDIAVAIGFLGRGDMEKNVAAGLVAYLGNPSNNDLQVRLEVVQSLQRLHDTRVIPQLLALLRSHPGPVKNDPHDNERVQIVRTLGSLVPSSTEEQDQKDAITALFNILQACADGGELAHVCTIVLGRWLKIPSLLDLVIPQLQNLQQKSLWLSRRVAVLLALFGQDDNEQSAQLDPSTLFSQNEPADPDLIELLKGLELSGYTQTTRFFEALVPLILKTEVQRAVRSRLAQTLGELGDKNVAMKALSYLLNENLDDTVLNMLVQVVQKLYMKGKICMADAIGPLYDLLSRLVERDSEGCILISLTETLAMMPHDQATRDLQDTIEILRDSKHRRKALTGTGKHYTIALGYLGDETVLHDLVSLLCDQTIMNDTVQECNLRGKIADVLGRFSRRNDQRIVEQWEGIVQVLEAQLGDHSLGKQVRSSIVEALQSVAHNIRDKDREKQICMILVQYIRESDLAEQVYQAVKLVSKSFRVIEAKDGSGIRIESFVEHASLSP